MDGIYLNPKNADVFKACVTETTPGGPRPIDSFVGLPVYFSEHIPERNIHEQWCPPESKSPFVEYGPEDEHWMRPAGLGTVKQFDMGPLVLAMQERLNRSLDLMFSEAYLPEFGNSYSASFTDHSVFRNYFT